MNLFIQIVGLHHTSEMYKTVETCSIDVYHRNNGYVKYHEKFLFIYLFIF